MLKQLFRPYAKKKVGLIGIRRHGNPLPADEPGRESGTMDVHTLDASLSGGDDEIMRGAEITNGSLRAPRVVEAHCHVSEITPPGQCPCR